MIINIDNITPYLIEKKLVDIESIIDGDLRIVDISRKNRNLKVVRKNAVSLLMKQANIGDKYSRLTIQREASLYEAVYSMTELTSIRSVFPRFLGYDPNADILTIEFVNEAESLNEYFYNTSFDKLPTEPSLRLGILMASYHKAFETLIDDEKFSLFPKSHPFPFLLARPGPTIFSSLSPANLQLLKVLQKYPVISDYLTNLHNEWKIQTLIHGDIKWDNVIVRKNIDTKSLIDMKIVDWELCELGDPCWDIGGTLQDFISFWLFSIPLTGRESPDQLIKSAEYPLQNMKDSIRAFWQGYTKTTGIKGVEADELLYKSTKYSAARLIHKAYESQQKLTQLSNTAVYMIQTSLNILNDIESSIIHLFGIPFTYRGSN